MNQARIGELHRGLYAALDNVQESYAMLKAGAVADDAMCHDLMERAIEAWQSSTKATSLTSSQFT